VVPEGFYLKGPGQVAPCPKGEFKSGVGPTASCTKCAYGVTTRAVGSTSEANCTVLLPSYFAEVMRSGAIKSAKTCPQSVVCAGGEPTAAYDPSHPDVTTGTTVAACAAGTWTEGVGASSATACSEFLLLWKHRVCSCSTNCGTMQSELRALPQPCCGHAARLACYLQENMGNLRTALIQHSSSSKLDRDRCHSIANATFYDMLGQLSKSSHCGSCGHPSNLTVFNTTTMHIVIPCPAGPLSDPTRLQDCQQHHLTLWRGRVSAWLEASHCCVDLQRVW